MPLELRKDRNGKIRNHWYGRYEANGKRYCVNLGVEIRGKIPASLKQFGDIAFERSRAEAQLKLKHLIEEVHSTKNASDLLKCAYEISQGGKYPWRIWRNPGRNYHVLEPLQSVMRWNVCVG